MHLSRRVLPVRLKPGGKSCILLACAGALLIGSCDRGERPESPPPSSPDPRPTGSGRVDLSIRGTSAQGLSSVRLGLERVSVTVDGTPALVTQRETALELASGTPVAAASFSIPESASTVHVTIALSSTGSWSGATGSGSIDARGLPISFDVAATALQRGTMEVDLDLGTSLQPAAGGGLVLLPDSAIFF